MKRIVMRKIKEVFRLKFEFLRSNANIAQAVGIGETTVEEYLCRARKAGISWPLPVDMDDVGLESLLYPSKDKTLKHLPVPHEKIHREFKKKNVTLNLLWEEYVREAQSSFRTPYSYSTFCESYQKWKQEDDTWMIQNHKAGESTFVDYAGLTIPVFDQETGEKEFDAQIFVSALGASGYIFCRAERSQKIEDWVGCHKKMSEYYGGVTQCWVPDNLKSAVTRADRYEPDINLTYSEAAAHYGAAVIPARVRKPRDKSKVESSVYLVETQILARLRDTRFYSLYDLNAAVLPLLDAVNRKSFRKMAGSSRRSLYIEIDRPALKPLPECPYELFFWGTCKVDKSYHILVEGVRYSVPYILAGRVVECRHNNRIIEFFSGGKQVAVHIRSAKAGDVVTDLTHLPKKHLGQARISPETLEAEAGEIGEEALQWVSEVLRDESLPIKQRINTALGLVRLSKKYPSERVNAACRRGVFYRNFKYGGIKDMLARGFDRIPLLPETAIVLPQNHGNVRGSHYYR
jgi:transposase